MTNTYDPNAFTLSFFGYPISGFQEGTFISVERSSETYARVVGVGDTSRTRSHDKGGNTSCSRDKKNDMIAISEHLRGLASGKRKPKDKQQGIAVELVDHIGRSGVVGMCFDFMKEWKDFSGNHTAPIGNGVEDYLTNDKHWSGEYGESNKRLCKYLSVKFNEELTNE